MIKKGYFWGGLPYVYHDKKLYIGQPDEFHIDLIEKTSKNLYDDLMGLWMHGETVTGRIWLTAGKLRTYDVQGKERLTKTTLAAVDKAIKEKFGADDDPKGKGYSFTGAVVLQGLPPVTGRALRPDKHARREIESLMNEPYVVVAQIVDVDYAWLTGNAGSNDMPDTCMGIVSEKGGTQSHGAIVARENNRPCVVDASGVKKVRQGDEVTIYTEKTEEKKLGQVDVNGGGAPQKGDKPIGHPHSTFAYSNGNSIINSDLDEDAKKRYLDKFGLWSDEHGTTGRIHKGGYAHYDNADLAPHFIEDLTDHIQRKHYDTHTVSSDEPLYEKKGKAEVARFVFYGGQLNDRQVDPEDPFNPNAMHQAIVEDLQEKNPDDFMGVMSALGTGAGVVYSNGTADVYTGESKTRVPEIEDAIKKEYPDVRKINWGGHYGGEMGAVSVQTPDESPASDDSDVSPTLDWGAIAETPANKPDAAIDWGALSHVMDTKYSTKANEEGRHSCPHCYSHTNKLLDKDEKLFKCLTCKKEFKDNDLVSNPKKSSEEVYLDDRFVLSYRSDGSCRNCGSHSLKEDGQCMQCGYMHEEDPRLHSSDYFDSSDDWMGGFSASNKYNNSITTEGVPTQSSRRGGGMGDKGGEPTFSGDTVSGGFGKEAEIDPDFAYPPGNRVPYPGYEDQYEDQLKADEEDEECPRCGMWNVKDGRCTNCGWDPVWDNEIDYRKRFGSPKEAAEEYQLPDIKPLPLEPGTRVNIVSRGETSARLFGQTGTVIQTKDYDPWGYGEDSVVEVELDDPEMAQGYGDDPVDAKVWIYRSDLRKIGSHNKEAAGIYCPNCGSGNVNENASTREAMCNTCRWEGTIEELENRPIITDDLGRWEDEGGQHYASDSPHSPYHVQNRGPDEPQYQGVQKIGPSECPTCGADSVQISPNQRRCKNGHIFAKAYTKEAMSQWRCPQCGHWDYEYVQPRGGVGWHDCENCGWKEGPQPQDLETREAATTFADPDDELEEQYAMDPACPQCGTQMVPDDEGIVDYECPDCGYIHKEGSNFRSPKESMATHKEIVITHGNQKCPNCGASGAGHWTKYVSAKGNNKVKCNNCGMNFHTSLDKLGPGVGEHINQPSSPWGPSHPDYDQDNEEYCEICDDYYYGDYDDHAAENHSGNWGGHSLDEHTPTLEEALQHSTYASGRFGFVVGPDGKGHLAMNDDDHYPVMDRLRNEIFGGDWIKMASALQAWGTIGVSKPNKSISIYLTTDVGRIDDEAREPLEKYLTETTGIPASGIKIEGNSAGTNTDEYGYSTFLGWGDPDKPDFGGLKPDTPPPGQATIDWDAMSAPTEEPKQSTYKLGQKGLTTDISFAEPITWTLIVEGSYGEEVVSMHSSSSQKAVDYYKKQGLNPIAILPGYHNIQDFQKEAKTAKVSDTHGQPLQAGKTYIMRSVKYKVPDIVMLKSVNPDHLEAVIAGDNKGYFPINITLEDYDKYKYTFEPKIGSAEEEEKVKAWRFEQLTSKGMSYDDANELASDFHLPYQEVVDAIDKGATPEQAAQIYRPIKQAAIPYDQETGNGGMMDDDDDVNCPLCNHPVIYDDNDEPFCPNCGWDDDYDDYIDQKPNLTLIPGGKEGAMKEAARPGEMGTTDIQHCPWCGSTAIDPEVGTTCLDCGSPLDLGDRANDYEGNPPADARSEDVDAMLQDFGGGLSFSSIKEAAMNREVVELAEKVLKDPYATIGQFRNIRPEAIDTLTTLAQAIVDEWHTQGEQGWAKRELNQYRSNNFRGKSGGLSAQEQHELVNEQGTARNIEKLNLEGTHYTPEDNELETYFLWDE